MMKTLRFLLLPALMLLAGFSANSQARLQVIHNSADEAVTVIDVWLDDTLLLDNFEFRKASPFMDAPAGEEFTISILGPDSQNPDDPLWSQTYTLVDGETYIMVADGMISLAGYDPLVPFDLAVFPMGREVAAQAAQTDLLVHHGSTDAPTIDIYETGVGLGLIVDDLSYPEFDGYLEVDTKEYILEVWDATGATKIAAYNAPLQLLGLKGEAVTILASGFLDPGSNSNGPAFGLWLAIAAGGDLIELEPYDPKARVQIIHNSADAAAAVVDVWLDQTLLIDNFEFRTASPFVDAPADTEFTISILGPDSQNPSEPLWSQTYTLADGSTYLLVAEGILSASGYDPAVPFDIAVFPTAREIANLTGNTDMLVHHGSTDAPVIDIYETGVGVGLLVNDLMYGEFSTYLELDPLDYILEVRDQTGTTTLRAYQAPWQTMGLAGEAITVVASGFLDPSNNSNGPAFGLWVALAEGGDLIELQPYVSTARVQLIHNSADAAAAVVDVWLDETLLVDDFAFRTATPFIDAPAGIEFTVAILGPDSQDPGDPIWSNTYTLEDGKTYILVADGIVSPSGYEPPVPFDIKVYPSGREVANIPNQTDMIIHHGSTDAPTLDIIEVGLGIGTIYNDLAYGQYTNYLGLTPINYIFELRHASGAPYLAAYYAPFGDLGLQGAAVSIVASGFLEPGNNSNGDEFGLWMAYASGGALVELEKYTPLARAQVIHNSADEAASVVDIWLDETLLLDDFAFRTASPFMDIPAKESITIAVTGPDSSSPEDPIWSQPYNLEEDGTYVLVAEGIVSPSGYDPNIPFNIAVYPMAREAALVGSQVDLLVHHGSTDAPTVDIYETGIGGGLLVNDISYAEFDGYLPLEALDYMLEVRDETGTSTVAAFRAPLATLGMAGEALTVVASGFLDPASNSNGPAFGLWAALPAGGPLVALPMYDPFARVQLIHNSADAAAAIIDVWLNDSLVLDNFAFRSATPFLEVPTGAEFTLAIKGPDSQDPSDPLWSANYSLLVDTRYILVANGILSASGYDPATPFGLYAYTGARNMATVSTNTDVLVFHGATDIPAIDMVEVGTGAGSLVNNLAYGDFDGYLELPTDNYSIDVSDAAGATALANFAAPLATLNLDGKSVTLLTSGFLEPGNNSGGAPFGLLAVLADGTAMMLMNTTGVEETLVDNSTFKLFPNPASEQVNIRFDLKEKGQVTIEVMDATGRVLTSTDLGLRNAGTVSEQVQVLELPAGMYLVTIKSSQSYLSRKLFVK